MSTCRHRTFLNTAHIKDMLLGLARVSTDKQSLARQLDALAGAGVEPSRIVVEHGVSGAKTHREGLDELLRLVREGDEVVVAELSRLGRRTSQVLQLVETLSERGVTVRCLQPALVFDVSPMSRLLLALLAAVAEMELETLRQRTREGVAAAKARGRVGGRPRVLTAAQVRQVRRMRAEGVTLAECAEIFAVSVSTIRRSCDVGVRKQEDAL